MPEAYFLCIDSTEFMRNGDYMPTRIMAVQEAVSLLLNGKAETNRENTFGFLTTGGATCTVAETLTGDVDRVSASATRIPLAGQRAFFARGLQVAALALSHRDNPRAEKRVIAFVGSPVVEPAAELEKLAKKLRKDDVAVDVVSLGPVEANRPLLADFVGKVGKNGNSHLLEVPPGASVLDALLTSAIFLGDEAAAAAVAAGGGGADGGGTGGARGGGGFEFGVDPSQDPELAMVLRMSLEDERQRQQAAAAAAAAGGAAAPPAVAPANEDESAAPAGGGAAAAAPEHEMTADEEMEMALRLSLEAAQEAEAAAAGSAAAPAAAGAAAAPAGAPPSAEQAAAQAAMADEEFMRQLQEQMLQQQQPPPSGDKKKEGGDAK